MGIKQLPKPQTGLVEVDRVLNEHVDKLNPILRALPPASGGQFAQMTWIALTLINGWSAWTPTVDNLFLQPAYMMDTQGFVHLRGLIRNAAGVAGNSVAFVLPVGFRPAAEGLFTTFGGSGAFRMDIASDGRAIFTSAVAALDFRSLDGITFDTRR